MRGRATAVIGLLLISGCGPLRPRAEPVAEAPTSVTVQQDRIDAVRGTVEVELAPLDRPYELVALQLDDARFAQVPATPRRTTVDRLLHISIDLGAAICPAEEDRAGRVRLWLSGTDGPVTAPIDAAGDAVLGGIHDAECRRRAVADAVDIRFGDRWVASGRAAARGVVEVIRRNAQDPIVLEGMEGTVIFTLTVPGGSGPVAELAPDATAVEVEVEVSAARCDPHALVESKKTYLFPTWVRVGDEQPVFLTIEPVGEARQVLERLLEVGCGLAGTERTG